MTHSLYRYGIAAVNSAKIFFYTLSLWPVGTWLRFWFTFPSEMTIQLSPLSVRIRTKTMRKKVVDLYMAISCIKFNQYTPNGFEIKPDDFVIDIGAHVGSFSLLAGSRATRGAVIAYEPDPENYTQWVHNINDAKFSHVSIEQKAVSAKSGPITFHHDEKNNAESSIHKQGSHSFTVTSTTLADIVNDHAIQKCNVLKLDCEGAEYDIIFGSPPALFEKIEKIVMECHTPQYFDITNPLYSEQAMIKKLHELGYQTRVVPENKMHSLIFARR